MKHDGWAIKSPRTGILPHTFWLKKCDAIWAFLNDCDEELGEWKRFEGLGYRCVKVKLVEVD